MAKEVFDTTEVSRGSDDFVAGDVVRLYTEGTELQFPCLVLTCSQIEKFRVEAMRGLLGDTGVDGYRVYIHLGGSFVDVGYIPDTKLRIILNDVTFSTFEKTVHLDSQSTYRGDMLHALCPAT